MRLSKHMMIRSIGKTLMGVLLTGFCHLSASEAAPGTNAVAPGRVVVTNATQYWTKFSKPEERDREHAARLEMVIYYCDTNWDVYWGQWDGLSTFLPLHGLPKALRTGQKVRFEGPVLPAKQEFEWDKTVISVLSESNELEAIPVEGDLAAASKLKAKFVEVEGVVDSVRKLSASVCRLNLLADDLNADVFVHLDAPTDRWRDLAGKIIRLRGVYSPTLGSGGRLEELTLWTPGMEQIRVVGALADDPRFSLPLVAADRFEEAETNRVVRVAGVVHGQKPGETVTIWDGTGQIRILAKQRQPVRLGDAIQAIGYPETDGVNHILRKGLFCMDTHSNSPAAGPEEKRVLPLAEEVRALDQERLERHPPVRLQGVVTCLDNETNYVFVQDSSGGLRVRETRLESGERIQAGMLVTVEGTVGMGEFAPVVSNAKVRKGGEMALPDAPLITFEEALTGTEDGNWIQLRGYLRQVTKTAGKLELQLVAARGEFKAEVPASEAGQATVGSIVLVRGVCVVRANSKRQLTGVEIWSSSPGAVQTEQVAPADLFAAPNRSIASLRQFSLINALNSRVRTEGTVALQVPGECLCVQDGDNSLIALTSQRDLLRAGDRVAVVGFPGNDGGGFVLREAVYRCLSHGADPAPVTLADFQNAEADLDGLLVEARGTLLDVVRTATETRLVLRANGHVFEGKLTPGHLRPEDEPALNSRLAIKGVYRVQRDEYGKAASFLLSVRGPGDIAVLAPPPWLTERRGLYLLAGVAPVVALALFVTIQTRRKNQLLQAAQVELKSAHAELEERVKERTRALKEEAEARKRALDRLSETQDRLLLASRHAGMAEVATGVLHNIGNILNSVNVSASVIEGTLEKLRIDKFGKAADLLVSQDGELAKFLMEDPRGQALPGYLRQLADNMAENEQTLRAEVKSLAKQIDHVKAVVAWQQGLARGTGFYESVEPAELIEDALLINQAAYQQDGIKVTREFGSLPPVLADRHKILQILINLLSNARHAVTAPGAARKEVTLGLRLKDGERVRFEVADAGVGIPPENMKRIFSLGFTTKANGHGFGLHSGANSAAEMGGRLFALSEGAGRGATFVLELPINPQPGPSVPGDHTTAPPTEG